MNTETNTYRQRVLDEIEVLASASAQRDYERDVPIADVLRTRMYAVDYEDERLATDEYAQLGAGAAACLTCPTQACAGSCTYGLPVEKLLAPTHRMLAKKNIVA